MQRRGDKLSARCVRAEGQSGSLGARCAPRSPGKGRGGWLATRARRAIAAAATGCHCHTGSAPGAASGPAAGSLKLDKLLKRAFRGQVDIRCEGEVLDREGGEALVRVVQRYCDSPSLGVLIGSDLGWWKVSMPTAGAWSDDI